MGLGTVGTFVVSAIVLIGVFAAVALLFPQRHELGAVWAFCTLGALFSGVFLVGGLLQGYYSIWLIPLAMSAIDLRSPARNWATGIAIWTTTGLFAAARRAEFAGHPRMGRGALCHRGARGPTMEKDNRVVTRLNRAGQDLGRFRVPGLFSLK